MFNTFKSLFLKIKTKILILNKFFPIPYLFIVILVLVGGIGLFLFVRKKRKSEDKKPQLPSNFLKKIWERFLHNIPREFRRSISLYKQFIVFGEAGSGKTQLINTYTDWEGQAQQFYPSYTKETDLQLYLSSSAVVQEIPSWILKDTSKEIRKALKKLWKPLVKREPEVIVTLSVLELLEGFSEHLKAYAQSVRGKLNIISELRKYPAKVRIVLTYMDQIEGFFELEEFLAKNGFCLKLKGDSLDQLKESLSKYEDLLPHILTSCPASHYIKIISFIKRIEELLPTLGEFIKTLKIKDPLSLTPLCDEIFFTSMKSQNPAVTTPFSFSDYKVSTFQEKAPLIKHKIAAALSGLILIVGTSALFGYEYSNFKRITAALNEIESKKFVDKSQFLHCLLKRLEKDKERIISTTFPVFFSFLNDSIRFRCLKDLNDLYIFPKILQIIQDYNKFRNNKNAFKAIYCVSLLYSTKDNDLGKLVVNNLSNFSSVLKLKSYLIQDYVFYSMYKFNQTRIKEIPVIIYDVTKDLKIDLDRIILFFELIDHYLSSDNENLIISLSEFDLVKEEAYYLINVLKKIENYNLVYKLSKLINMNSYVKVIFIGKEIFKIDQKSMNEALLTILKTELNLDKSIFEYSLPDFIEYLDIINKTSFKSSNLSSWYINIKNKKFYFSIEKWNELIKSSELFYLIKRYMETNNLATELIFFKQPTAFDDVVLNPTNKGNFLFIGKARIKGIYTKKAFDLVIKPLLERINRTVKELPIPLDEKELFLNFVYSIVDLYAFNYAEKYINYLNSFSIRADTLGELKLVLVQLQQPHSPLMDLLLTVKKNTVLDINKNNPLMLPFLERFYQFKWIWHLMKEENGVYPEYEKYKVILSQLFYEIERPFSESESKELKGFESLLSPLGKVSFDIYLNKKDSYLNLLKLWLDSVNIPLKWHSLFLAPVEEAYKIGLKEIEFKVKEIWDSLWRRDIYPVLSLFPFNKETNEFATINDLKKITDPKGEFWISFEKFLKNFVVKDERGFWKEREFIKSINLPSNLVPSLNYLSKLSKRLWSKKGSPIPLIFYIKPLPLPRKISDNPYFPVLSYLKIGNSSVFGFNQRPTWQKLKFFWWKKQNAVVGVKLFAEKRPMKIKEICVTDSLWNLLVLLNSSVRVNYVHDKPLYVWKFSLPVVNSSHKGIPRFIFIKFLFKEDPWKIFEVPVSLYKD